MRNPDRQTTFRFKHFEVRNERAAMKVGTDGVLLGAWTAIPGGQADTPAGAGVPSVPSDMWTPTHLRILDIGTGSGVIALMLAQRAPGASILACDIDREAVREADANFAASPWADRLKAVTADIRHVIEGSSPEKPQSEGATSDWISPEGFDIIVCNPPFFSGGDLAPDLQRRAARSDDSLLPEELFEVGSRLLSPEGHLAVIYPADREAKLLTAAVDKGLYPRHLCRVTTVPRKPPRRILLEFSKSAGECQESALTIHTSDGAFSPEYLSLLKDFYLHF